MSISTADEAMCCELLSSGTPPQARISQILDTVAQTQAHFGLNGSEVCRYLVFT